MTCQPPLTDGSVSCTPRPALELLELARLDQTAGESGRYGSSRSELLNSNMEEA